VVDIQDKGLLATVAGTPAGQGIFQYDKGGPDWHAPWADLPKAELVVTPDESLRRVLTRAAEELGVSLTAGAARAHEHNRPSGSAPSGPEAVIETTAYVAFHRPDDDDPPEVPEGMARRDERSRKHTVLVVRDGEGRAVWRRPPLDATIGELLDAGEAGLLEGDPLELYLVLSIPQGGIGGYAEWQQLQQALEAAWHLRGLFGELITYLSFIGAVSRWAKRRSNKGAEAVERHSADWARRGAAPADLENLLAARPRGSTEVAALLGCSREEAEAILWALGFVPRKDGTWIRRRRRRRGRTRR
jgi:hypothetical protein